MPFVRRGLAGFPGHDEAGERAMIEEFVVPIVTPVSARG
jgi:hypothetical protein